MIIASRGATQNYFKQLGTIKLKLSYGGNTVKDTITIVDGQLVVPILIRWNSTAALRNDLTYPATLNQVDCAPGKEEYSSVGKSNFPKMKNLPDDPSDEQIDQIKCKIVQEFRDVFSDGAAVSKPMACEPSEIDVVTEAVPI